MKGCQFGFLISDRGLKESGGLVSSLTICVHNPRYLARCLAMCFIFDGLQVDMDFLTKGQPQKERGHLLLQFSVNWDHIAGQMAQQEGSDDPRVAMEVQDKGY
eukprot:scaffold270635_cov22-Tisochrysis_lutea.AAC.1